MMKYKDYGKYDSFYVDLIFSYSNSSIYNLENDFYKMQHIMKNLHNLSLSMNKKNFAPIYAIKCLDMKKYDLAYDYLWTFNNVNGPNVTPKTMSFFSNEDVGKDLLVYDGGGIGDAIMFSRFLFDVCNKYRNCTIYYIYDSEMNWIFSKVFEHVPNLRLTTYQTGVGAFDHHCSLVSLIAYLKYSHNSITFTPLFQIWTFQYPRILKT